MKYITLKHSIFFLFSMLLLVIVSCEKMADGYDKYLDGGEITYPGKADSLSAFPGNKRIALQWLIISDPKVDKAVVYWNNKADSVIVPIQKTSGIDTIRIILPDMEEGLYTFDVVTHDKAGNRSIGSQVIGEVYGNSYARTISNRLIRSVSWLDLPQNGNIPPFKGAEISWYGVNAQAIFIDITYTKEDGTQASIREKPIKMPDREPFFRETTRLPDCSANSIIEYRTAFLPDDLAIDTFYTETKQYNNR